MKKEPQDFEQAPTAEYQHAVSLGVNGELTRASRAAQILLRRYPSDLRLWQLLSNIQARSGDLQGAVASTESALAIAPHDPRSLLQYGRSLALLGHRRQALAIATALAARSFQRADLYDGLGTLFTYCEEPKRALPFFERAVALGPNNGDYLYNLASAQRMCGDLTAAEASLDSTLAINPSDVRALYMRSDVRIQTPTRNHVAEMVRLLESGKCSAPDISMLSFAIAKELEDLGSCQQSFTYLTRGCETQRASFRYDVDADIATIDNIIRAHNRSSVSNSKGFDTGECIFIFGLPRSGTTLVERILGSHSAVYAAGELQAFPMETMKAVQQQTNRSIDKIEFVERAMEVDAATLGRAYIEATRPQTGGTPRFIDKLPLNYLYAGLINRSLPASRMVCLARDPLDNCYAMYKTLFPQNYPFSYDLRELGKYYVAWHRLIQHWQITLGDSLLVVQYEDLVSNPELISRRIVEHCRLPWETACLRSHEQRIGTTTASASQVRQPIYSTSVGKSRLYERQLAALAVILQAAEPVNGWRL